MTRFEALVNGRELGDDHEGCILKSPHEGACLPPHARNYMDQPALDSEFPGGIRINPTAAGPEVPPDVVPMQWVDAYARSMAQELQKIVAGCEAQIGSLKADVNSLYAERDAQAKKLAERRARIAAAIAAKRAAPPPPTRWQKVKDYLFG